MRFSIVTPSFNQLDWLELCVASVRDQVAQAGDECRVPRAEAKEEGAAVPLMVEHLVCDGGSEGIEEFARRMGADFYRDGKKVFGFQCSVGGQLPEAYSLAIHCEKDAGMYDAINKGLRRATGDVCSYLNCDEQLLPGALALVGEFLGKYADTDVVFGDTIVVGRHGEPLCYWRPYVPSPRHLAGATLNTLSCSTFFRRRVVEAGHLFEPQWKTVGDLQWIRGLLEKKCRMACLPEPLSTFTFLGDNLGASAKAREEFETSRVAKDGPGRIFRRGLHGLRKLFSGAYVRRNVSYDLFLLSDPAQRRRFKSTSLGWRWPGLAKT